MTCSTEQALKDGYRIVDLLDQHPDVFDLLDRFGYSIAVVGVGKQTMARMEDARSAAHSCHGNQIEATQQLKALRDEVEASYAELAKLAKIVFAEQPAALEILGLRVGQRATPALIAGSNRRSKALPALLDTTRIFYANLLAHPELLATMATVGCSEPQVSEGLIKVEQLRKASSVQEMAIAAAKNAVQQQKQARREMDQWFKRFRNIAPIALRSRPDILMAMGLRP